MISGRLFAGNYKNKDDKTTDLLELANQSFENYLLKANQPELDKAIDYYIQAMKLKPAEAEVYYKLASLLWEKGDIDVDAAIDQCLNAVNLSPESPHAWMYLGYFYKIGGNYEESQKAFERSISLSGFINSSRPRLALSLCLIQKMHLFKPSFSDFIAAMKNLFSGIIMSLWDVPFLKLLYKGFMRDLSIIRYRVAGGVFRTFKDYNRAIENYEAAAEKAAKSDEFYSRVGDLSLEFGKPDMAVQGYKKALKTTPENSELWAKLATTLQVYFENDVYSIIDCYSKLVELESYNPRIYFELGHLYIKVEDKISAVNSFKRAVEIDETNPFYHNSLAYAMVLVEDYDAAIEEYQKAINLSPDNKWSSIVSQSLGSIYHQIKFNIDAAIVAYRSAITLDKENADAYLALGEAYYDKFDLTKAIDCFCEAVKIDNENPKLYCNLGLALWEKDYLEEAVISFEKAVALNPNYDIAFNNLGVVYLDGLDSSNQAAINFDMAVNINPNYTLAYFNQGRAYEKLNEKTKAANAYQMALDLNKLTNDLDSEEIEDRIYNLFCV